MAKRPRGERREAATRWSWGKGAAAFVVLVLLAVVGGRVWMNAVEPPKEWSVEDQERVFRPIRKLLAGEQLQKAAEELDKLLSEDDPPLLAFVMRAQLFMNAGDLDAAAKLLAKVPDGSAGESSTARMLEGILALENGRAVSAEELWKRAIRQNVHSIEPWERLSQLYLTQGRSSELRKALVELSRRRRLSLDELVVLGNCYELYYSSEERLPQLERQLKTDPNDSKSRAAISRYHLANDQTDAALAVSNSQDKPPDPEVSCQRAFALVRMGNLTDAFAELRPWANGFETAPAQIHRAWGVLEQERMNWTASAWHLQKWLEENPDDLQMLYRFGQVLERCGDSVKGKQILARAVVLERLLTNVYRVRRMGRQRPDRMRPVIVDIANDLLSLGRVAEAVLWIQEFPVANEESNLEAWTGLLARTDSLVRSRYPSGQISLDLDPRVPEVVDVALKTPESIPSGLAQRVDAQSDPVRSEDQRPQSNSTIRLSDVHDAVGVNFQFENGGVGRKWLIESLGGGVAVFDYDSDGWPDLYFTQGGRIPGDETKPVLRDVLYRNRGDGTFEDVTTAARLGDEDYTQGVAVSDFDNDGDPDLAIANLGKCRLYRNEGDGTFSDISESAGVVGGFWNTSLGFGDFNLDGFPDLYVVTYVLEPFKTCRDASGEYLSCSPANYQAEEDYLLLNKGDGAFQDISVQAGIRVPDGKGLGVVIVDFDNDRRPDIYVANDGTPNFLFHNVGVSEGGLPRFEEVGLVSGSALSGDGLSQAGMGIAAADIDGNGWIDLYVTNFFREYNTLYLNYGGLEFRDATIPAGLVEPTRLMLGFGTQAIDADRSGRQHLIVANGHIDNFHVRGEPWKMPPQMFENDGKGRFRDVSRTAGEFFIGERLGRGLATGDFDRDGRIDVVVVHQDRPAAILRNETSPLGAELMLTLVGVISSREGLGARIIAESEDQRWIHEVSGGNGYFAANERRVLLGFGDKSKLDRVSVVWPSGVVTKVENVKLPAHLTVVESVPPAQFEARHNPQK